MLIHAHTCSYMLISASAPAYTNSLTAVTMGSNAAGRAPIRTAAALLLAAIPLATLVFASLAPSCLDSSTARIDGGEDGETQSYK